MLSSLCTHNSVPLVSLSDFVLELCKAKLRCTFSINSGCNDNVNELLASLLLEPIVAIIVLQELLLLVCSRVEGADCKFVPFSSCSSLVKSTFFKSFGVNAKVAVESLNCTKSRNAAAAASARAIFLLRPFP